MPAVRNVKALKNQPQNDKYAIILLYAGGNAKMKNGPRPLLQLNNKYLYEHHLKNIERRFGALSHSVIAVTGFEATKIMTHLPDTVLKVENENYAESNVARSIGMGLRVTNASNVIVIYGDLFFTHQALDFELDKSCVVVDKAGHMDTMIGCSTTGESIDLMLYGMPYKWCEIAYFTGKELDNLKKICWDDNKHKLFGFELINEIIDKGGNFNIYGNEKAKVCDIDCAKHLIKAKEIIV